MANAGRRMESYPGGEVMDTNEEEAPCPRAAASMQAFDSMPETFRRFCANYPRTAKGQSLAQVLNECGGQVPQARRLLPDLLPVRRRS